MFTMKQSLLTIMLRYLLAFALISMGFCSKAGELPPEAKHQCLPMYWSWKKQLLKYLSYANGQRLVYQPSLMREAVKVTANLQAPKPGHKDLWVEFKNNESSKLEILYQFRKEYEIKLWKKRKNKKNRFARLRKVGCSICTSEVFTYGFFACVFAE